MFIFNTSPHKTQNMDTISDFSIADDTIKLDNAVFTKVSANGRLKAAGVLDGGKAHDRSDRIIYEIGLAHSIMTQMRTLGKSGLVKCSPNDKRTWAD